MLRIVAGITLLLTLVIGFSGYTLAQKFTISGHVKDIQSGEDIIGATVSVDELKMGVATNLYGFYSLTLAAGTYNLTFNSLGYTPVKRKVILDKDQIVDINLENKSEELKEVVISSEKTDANVKSMEMSVAKLDIKTVQKVPALLGEVDVIRAIQLLPGVSTVGEGASGFNVRGGSIDQNLILLDEAPVYNSSHLFGFFSVFNPDAVKDVKLVKGGIPAQYGGRLSSLLDVRLKEGNNKQYKVNGGIGTIFSRISVEGPLIKERSSFIVALRRSYFDYLFFPFSKNEDIRKSKAYFYDLTVKLNTVLTERDRIFLSGYFGRDAFGFGDPQFGFNWGNGTGTFRWNHVYNSRIFSNISAIYSNYDYQLGVGDEVSGFSWKSRIINYSIKPEFSWYLNPKNTITFGGTSTIYNFDPGKLRFYSDGELREQGSKSKYTFENAIYAANEQRLGGRLSLQYGLRFSNFNYVGPGTTYTFRDTTGNLRRDTLSSTSWEKFDIIKSYFFIEPRFSVKFELNDKASLKASYNRTTQNLHLISNTTASTPLDIWVPSTNNIKPELADQVAAGYFRNFMDDMLETSAEVYYKSMLNQIDYIDGANLLLNELLEGELINGKGRAYGLELYIRKTRGKLNGWISYTLARTERKVNGINNNEWYPNRFDKLHTANVVATYDYNERLEFGSTFVFATGTPATFPTNRLEWQGYIIPHNVDNIRNNTRIPPYHRLDLSATYHFKKKRKNFESNLVLSAYNVYARRNPFSIYFQSNPGNPLQTQAIRFSVVGNIIPALTYNFKF